MRRPGKALSATQRLLATNAGGAVIFLQKRRSAVTPRDDPLSPLGRPADPPTLFPCPRRRIADTPTHRYMSLGRRFGGSKFPEIGKDSIRKPECHRELKFFFQRITDGTDPIVRGLGDPAFQTRPEHTGHDRVIAPIKNLAGVFAQAIQRSQMSDLGKSGEIPVKVRKRFSHLIKLIEVVPIPWQGWS